eukprot:3729448-Amphidinium_carterae.1
MAPRCKSRALPCCTLLASAFFLPSVPSCGFLAAPRNYAKAEAGWSPLQACGVHAAMLASLPLPAHAKGVADMDTLLPFVAVGSMSMMAILIAWQHMPQARKVEEQTLTKP